MVPGRLLVLCELRSKRVVYLRLVIVHAVRDVGRARAARVHQVLCETGKKWCGDYGYDPEMKRQSLQWKSADSPRPKKACQVRSKVKVMLIVFFDMEALFIMSTFHKAKL